MMRPAFLATESQPAVVDLRKRLDAFYSSTTDYSDFKVESNSKPEIWTPIMKVIEERLAKQETCRALEFGAGRTGFGRFLGAIRSRVRYEVQDVTPQNREHLVVEADAVHIGDLREVGGSYDVIFSTFVWEHVTNPRQTRDVLLGMLAPGGSLFIACPRYDFPGYIPPSARHYGLVRRMGIMAWQAVRWVGIGCGDRFLIHTDPAMFHRPWFRDSDAIHWVALRDFAALPNGYRCERIRLQTHGVRNWIWESLLLAFVRVVREDAA